LASRRLDTEIDRLYQLPPDEFTAARNALAKDAGADRAEIRALVKPPIGAWAVNQVYWKQRDIYDALIGASTELRKAHKAILAGRAADIREVGKAHDNAVESALKAALAILREHGHPATDATRQAIMTTLRALPGDEPAGRLSRTLQPGGFEMLAGLSLGTKPATPFRPKSDPTPIDPSKPAATATEREPATATVPSRAAAAGKHRKGKDGKAAASADAAQIKAEQRKAAQAEAAQKKLLREGAARAVREAEQAVRREQFEAARLTREARETDKLVEQAREALDEAQEALRRAETRAGDASRERDAALERSRERERELHAAREAAKKT
jgi:hypothetical protein